MLGSLRFEWAGVWGRRRDRINDSDSHFHYQDDEGRSLTAVNGAQERDAREGSIARERRRRTLALRAAPAGSPIARIHAGERSDPAAGGNVRKAGGVLVEAA
ncbi:hypothetical protein [Anaeromyxobacter oryzisoli]|uniref:hypothetical protein n=1 Tax=Anaeromyxobacter oryzisoli TaxID=2925408 RepID=UPI001F5AF8CD|nr:hypothetical protein [Anaeromyxobacter sp. SG63]